MENISIPIIIINGRKMIDAKYVYRLLNYKIDFKHWIKDIISSFDLASEIDYVSYVYDNRGNIVINNGVHVFRRDYYLSPRVLLYIICAKCDKITFKDIIDFIIDILGDEDENHTLSIASRFIHSCNNRDKKMGDYYTYIIKDNSNGFYKIGKSVNIKRRLSTLSASNKDLILIAYINKDIEKELHMKFDIKGIYREWFNLSNKDLCDIINKYGFKICDRNYVFGYKSM